MQKIVKPLLIWYRKNARDLPWRREAEPYHIWISEIMLQQTRVEAVLEYYRRFLQKLPTVNALAEVDTEELMKLWQGLGYYNRARNLQKAAQIIVKEYHGIFPKEYQTLLTLPGIGEYTAGAIASIAYGEPVPAVDGNVYRIYTRLCADDGDISRSEMKRRVREQIQEIIPKDQAGTFNQAWMDLGSGICLPNGQPLCEKCPLEFACQARVQGNVLEYPVKPAKKERRREEKTIILLEYQGKFLLQKRPEKGLLAGLWEFPSQEGRMDLGKLKTLLKELGGQEDKIELLGKGKHIFSHIEWHMIGYLVHLRRPPEEAILQNSVWSTLDEMEGRYSIPSAFRTYYDKIKILRSDM